jgi:hypothetical protein
MTTDKYQDDENDFIKKNDDIVIRNFVCGR